MPPWDFYKKVDFEILAGFGWGLFVLFNIQKEGIPALPAGRPEHPWTRGRALIQTSSRRACVWSQSPLRAVVTRIALSLVAMARIATKPASESIRHPAL
jgi:hypothetical protein